jgi:hypothetical protein
LALQTTGRRRRREAAERHDLIDYESRRLQKVRPS